MRQRLKIAGYGILIGAAFALIVAGQMMPSGKSFWNRAFIWTVIMGGPVTSAVWDMTTIPIISLGWLGFCLIPAHPIRPHWVTGWLTAAGLVLWFLSGFATVMRAVYGA